MNLETACRAHLEHLEFREGPLWTYTDPYANSRIVSPAFDAREDAEAWQAPYLEEQAANRRAAEEAAQAAAEKARVASANASLCGPTPNSPAADPGRG